MPWNPATEIMARIIYTASVTRPETHLPRADKTSTYSYLNPHSRIQPEIAHAGKRTAHKPHAHTLHHRGGFRGAVLPGVHWAGRWGGRAGPGLRWRSMFSAE